MEGVNPAAAAAASRSTGAGSSAAGSPRQDPPGAGRAQPDDGSREPAATRSPLPDPGSSDAIVIVGGGFGGLYTALALSEQPGHPPILLIEPQEQFLFLPLLYELLSGELRRWEIAPRYDRLLAGRGIAWLQDRVERIDTTRHQLHTRCGRLLSYRQLVLACGGHSTDFGVPGVDRHSQTFRSLADVERLQALVARLAERHRPLQRVAIVGGGPSGVELACKLADLCNGSALIELIEQGPQLLPQSRAFNREQAEQALRRRDVRVRTRTAVTAVEADRLRLHHHRLPPIEASPLTPSDELLPLEAVIWTAGQRFRPPVIEPEAPQDASGRLLCEASLRLPRHPDVFVIGDLAHIASASPHLPDTAQVAFQQAVLLARNLLRSRAGERLEPFEWKDLGEMLSLGLQEASLCAAGLTLAGRAAFQIRRLAYLSRMPGLPHTLRVAAGWLAERQR